MTQALWVLCLLLLAAGYIAAPSGPVLAAELAALALPVLSWLAVLLCRRKLRAELSCPASAEKGRPAAVRLTLRRPRALPVGRVRFHLAAENTVTGETACMTLPEGESAVSGRLCGCLTLRITGVTVWDAFSLLPVPAQPEAGVVKRYGGPEGPGSDPTGGAPGEIGDPDAAWQDEALLELEKMRF